MTAVRITQAVWLVGTPEEGSPAYTSRFDCNQYLVAEEDDAFLIDAGTGIAGTTWLENATEVLPLSRIRGLIVTHYHADHAGGAAAAARAGIRVWGTPATTEALRAGDEETTQLARARQAGVYPEDLRAEPVDAAYSLEENQTLPIGDGLLRILWSPGHCDGHLVVEHEKRDMSDLFTGDVLFAGGRISMQALPDCRLRAYADSVIALDEIRAAALFPGHGPSVLDGAHKDISLAADSFRKLIPPPNLLIPPGF